MTDSTYPPVAATSAPPSIGAVGAIVLGGDYQGLNIVRSLGRQGIPVCVIDDEQSIARYSKYCSHFVKAARLRTDEEIIQALLDAARRFPIAGWILYPTREEMVAAISRFRRQLSQTFRVPTPAWDAVQCAWDKRRTYQLANKLDIPTPCTMTPTNIEELESIDAVNFPLAIKPAIRERFVYATRSKAWRADNREELRALYKKAVDLVGPGEIMIQELIPGGGSQQYSYCAFFRDGNPVGKMTALRRRQHPLVFGKASTYVETVEVPILDEYSERFLRAINYYGLVELEYKLDPRNGQYKLLDVNARTWGYHSLGASAGVDFTYMLYRDQLGLAVTPAKAQAGIGWLRLTTDIPAALMAMFGGELTLREYLVSLAKCRSDAVFSMEDPLPGIVEILLVPYLAARRGF